MYFKNKVLIAVISCVISITFSKSTAAAQNSGDFKISMSLGVSLGESAMVKLKGIDLNSGWCTYRAIRGSAAYPGWFEYPPNFKVKNGNATTRLNATVPGRVHVTFICSKNKNPSYSDEIKFQAWTDVVIKNF